MLVPLSKVQARAELHALNSNFAQNHYFSHPTRTRFLLEARMNRLEEMGYTNMGFVGVTHFCKLARVGGC